MLGVGMSEPVRDQLAARSRRIRRVMRLDPLRLRDRLPRAWVEALFAWGARLVRRAGARAEGSARRRPGATSRSAAPTTRRASTGSRSAGAAR